MAKGFGFVKTAAAASAAKGGNSLWAGKLIFKLPSSGDQAVVRFVENEGDFVHGAWHHEVPVEGRAWGDLVPCIAQDEEGNRTDDPCPGCERDLPMKFKGYITLIWRDGPVYKTDEKGKVVKDNLGDPVVLDTKDQLAIWSSGPRLFENLAEIDEAYKSLGSRDFRVKRKGEKTATEYIITPAVIDGGPQEMSKEDEKLLADSEINLTEFVRAPSYDNFEARLNGQFTSNGGGNGSSGSGNSQPTQAGNANPFRRSA